MVLPYVDLSKCKRCPLKQLWIRNHEAHKCSDLIIAQCIKQGVFNNE